MQTERLIEGSSVVESGCRIAENLGGDVESMPITDSHSGQTYVSAIES